MLLILFGPSGSGKNFIGEILATHFGYYFWDADAILSDKMQEYIKEKKVFTQAMRDEFIQAMIEKVDELSRVHKKIVISQGLYKESNREAIHKAFPHALFIHVQSNSEIISQRMKNRKSIVDEAYAKKIQAEFEAPSLKHAVIENNSDINAIVNQFKKILK